MRVWLECVEKRCGVICGFECVERGVCMRWVMGVVTVAYVVIEMCREEVWWWCVCVCR